MPTRLPAGCRARCRAKARKYGTFRLPDNQNNTKKEKEVKEIRYARQDALKGLLKPVAGTSLPDIPAWLFLRKEEAMEKKRTQLHVTAIYDGGLDPTEAFVGLIRERYGSEKPKSVIEELEDTGYDGDEVQKSRVPSGLCG